MMNIKINKQTRMVDLSKTVIGNDGENLQGNLIFELDEFIDGQARLEYEIDNVKRFIPLQKVNQTYQAPIKSVITKKGTILMQLVITEGVKENEIPIFKSNEFYVWCNKSINAEMEQPEEYPTWIEIANTKLNQMDNLDINGVKQENKATLTISKKDGTKQVVEILDGAKGEQGIQGIQGKQGIQGLKGDKGEPGDITPEYVAMYQKTEQNVVKTNENVVITNDDVTKSNQNLQDLLKMIGTDIATLVNGKIPVNQIPSIATTEIYTATSQEEQDKIKAENGDILIRTDESKSYIWKDTGWVYLASPTDYSAKAGYAETAGVAENANKINGHRLVQMEIKDFETAVKDPNTYYLVYDNGAEK